MLILVFVKDRLMLIGPRIASFEMEVVAYKKTVKMLC